MPFRSVKTSTAHDHAARARQEGRTVFLYRFSVPGGPQLFSGPLTDAAEVIEAVESAGWVLADMAFSETSRRNGAVLLLFRPRRG